MDTVLRNKWITALESGGYTQGFGTYVYANGTKMCALGVLMNILQPGFRYPTQALHMQIEPALCDAKEKHAIIGLNDGEQLSFKEIANILKNGCAEDYVKDPTWFKIKAFFKNLFRRK
jgi:hypothetical protein